MVFIHRRSLIPRFVLTMILLIGVIGAAPAQAQSVVYRVSPGGVVNGSCGGDWSNPCDLQSALAAAVSGDEIWVAAGTYKPTSTTDRTISFVLKNGVAIYGGFAGMETGREQRDPTANSTTLSGDIGISGNSSDNSYHVVVGSGTDSSAVLDGFTITGGYAHGPLGSQWGGGGMYNDHGSPTLVNLIIAANWAYSGGGGMSNHYSNPSLTNVTFTGNSATDFGGGMNNSNSSPILTNVIFSGNVGTDFGGGMYNYRSNATLIDVTFSDNAADYWGGGMHNHTSIPSLTNVTFSGNSAPSGGGMYNHTAGDPNLMNVNFNGNSATWGGGMYNYNGSNPSLTHVTFEGNTAESGGGMFNIQNSATLADVTFSRNIAHAHGGGVYNQQTSNISITDVVFIENTGDFGGGMSNYSSSPTLSDVTFTGNTVYPSGGGMYNTTNSHPTLTNVTFTNNTALDGAGMYNTANSNPTLTNVTFHSNRVTSYSHGGGMYNNSSNPSLTNVTFSSNEARYGGGIYNSTSSPSLNNVIFNNNSADQIGGGISNYQSNPVLENVIFSENSAAWYGGGMSNEDNSNPTLMNVTFDGNTAASDTVVTAAGGMYNLGSSPSLNNVTFSNNSAEMGGGMANDLGGIPGTPFLINVTFSNNSASYGGAMLNRMGSSSFLGYVTLSNNSTTVDGGAIANDGHLFIMNGIVWGNTGGEISNTGSGTVTVANSIVQGGYEGDGNMNADPLLGPLQDNGGFTRTIALGAGSPAIDSADTSNCPPIDQRGVTRPQGSGCDIGAYEYQDSTAPTVLNVSSTTANGTYGAGSQIDVTVTFSEPVYVTGAPQLALETGATDRMAAYASGSGSATLTFSYTVQAGDQSTDLDYLSVNSLTLNGGTIQDAANNNAILTLPNPGAAGSLSANKAIVILTTTVTRPKSSGAQDGWVLETSETSNRGGTINPTAATFVLGDSAKNQQYRSILSFNTASLPDNAVITKIVLKIKKQSITGTNPFTTHGKITIDIRNGAFGNNPALQPTDFQAAGKLGVGLIANSPQAGGWYSSTTLKPFTYPYYPYINRMGITQFRLRFQIDDDNDSVADFLRFYSGNATAANRPVLVIEYYVP